MRAVGLTVFVGVLLAAAPSMAVANFHGGHTYPKLNYDSLMRAATPIDRSERGQKLLAACLKTYGGREQMAKRRTGKLVYHMVPMMSHDSITVIKTYAPGRQYRIKRYDTRGTEQRLLAGDTAYLIRRDSVQALQPLRYKAELFSYLMLNMPAALQEERFDAIRYGRRAGDSLEYLYALKNDSLLIALGIDPEKHTISKAEGMIIQDTSRIVFINLLGGYRHINGQLVPTSLINISMGLEVGRSRLVDVDFTPQFDEKEFRPSRVSR